jgi:hypothetical protein
MEGTLIMPVLLIVIVAVIILIAIMRSASKSKGMLARQCPYCKNYINGNATVCEYCHRERRIPISFASPKGHEHYRCGRTAANDLDAFIALRSAKCVEVDRDQYPRAVAV